METVHMSEPRPERRHKIVYVGLCDMLDIAIQHMTAAPGYRMRHRLVGVSLPEGYEVVNVHHDWARHAFGFLLSHPSFEPVPDGMPAPDLVGFAMFEAVEDRPPLDRPISQGDLLIAIHDALKSMGCEGGRKIGDPLRWSYSDLATDLAPLVKANLEAKR